MIAISCYDITIIDHFIRWSRQALFYIVLYYSLTLLQMYRLQQIASALSIWCEIPKKLTNAHVTVFAGLNQVSASLNRFKPHVWQKQVFSGRNPTLSLILNLNPNPTPRKWETTKWEVTLKLSVLSIGSRKSSLGEFQASGPAVANARWPYLLRCVVTQPGNDIWHNEDAVGAGSRFEAHLFWDHGTILLMKVMPSTMLSTDISRQYSSVSCNEFCIFIVRVKLIIIANTPLDRWNALVISILNWMFSAALAFGKSSQKFGRSRTWPDFGIMAGFRICQIRSRNPVQAWSTPRLESTST